MYGPTNSVTLRYIWVLRKEDLYLYGRDDTGFLQHTFSLEQQIFDWMLSLLKPIQLVKIIFFNYWYKQKLMKGEIDLTMYQ